MSYPADRINDLSSAFSAALDRTILAPTGLSPTGMMISEHDDELTLSISFNVQGHGMETDGITLPREVEQYIQAFCAAAGITIEDSFALAIEETPHLATTAEEKPRTPSITVDALAPFLA